MQFVIELPSMVGGNFPPLPPRGLDFEGVSVLHGPVFRRGGKWFFRGWLRLKGFIIRGNPVRYI